VAWPEEVAVDEVGIVLRGPDPVDAEAVVEAVNANRDHLRRFLPWAEEPAKVDATAVRFAAAREAFDLGADATYLLFDAVTDEVVGTIGLHRRRGPGRIEIGYWLVADAEGRGLITSCVRELLPICFADATIDIAQIRCHRDNVRSAAIPKRLGFAFVAEEDDHLVFELHR
jgi:RimJ/RimL family protein N-acetyltransferase